MKKILLLLFIVACNQLIAQDWQTVKYKQTDFFKLDTFKYHTVNYPEAWNHVAIKIDSVNQTGSDSVFYSFQSVNDTSTFSLEPCIAIKGPSWIGEFMKKTSGGDNIFYNLTHDAIIFKPMASIGTQWTAFTFPNNSYLTATLDSEKYEIVNSILDSVKYISMQFIDSIGNPASHVFNNRSFSISKSHGIICWYNMYNFPFDTVRYTLTSSHLLTNFDLYNYNIGDQFGYAFNYASPGGSSARGLKTILSKYLSPFNDSVYYTYQYKDVYHFVNYCCGTPFTDSIVSINTHNESHTNLDSLVFKEMPTEAMAKPNSIIGLSANYNLYQGDTAVYGGLEYYIENCGDYWIDSCYSSPGEVDLGRMTYVEGCGSFLSRRLNTNGPPYYNDNCNLIYIHKGAFSWGHSPDIALNVNTQELNSQWNVYPNPSKGLMNIVFQKELNSTPLFIHDISGRIIKSLVFEVHRGSVVQVNCEELTNGIYFFELNGSYKKVIISK